MQAEPWRLSVEVNSCELAGFEDFLGRLKGVREPALISLYGYESQANATGALYLLDVDEPGESLRDFALRIQSGIEPPFSSTDLCNVASACIQALSKAQELGLPIPALDVGVVYITKQRQVRVHAIEAFLDKGADSVARILAKCAFLREDCTETEMQTLPALFPAQVRPVIEQLLLSHPNYPSLVHSFPLCSPLESLKETKVCSNCNELKISEIAQPCERHFFCSRECLQGLLTKCPLCTVVKSFKVKQKNPGEIRKCGNCSREFELNLNEIWRVESGNKDALSSFCSVNCFRIHSESQAIVPAVPASAPDEKEQNSLAESSHMRSYQCLVCEKMSPIEGTLHCASHGLCSDNCRNVYYLRGSLEENAYQGVLICYNCLETDLQAIERIGEVPELEALSSKLMQRQDAIAKMQRVRQVQVVQCGSFLSLKALSCLHFRVLCVFCSNSVVVSKQFASDFAIDDTTPFLLSCELQLHAVCSTRCLRVNLPRNSLQTIRCPRCPNAVIVVETIQIALNHRNPTMECLRRTPFVDLCKVECNLTYYQKPCRHEFCGHVMDRYLSSDPANLSIICCICGSASPYEEVIATAGELTLVEEAL